MPDETSWSVPLFGDKIAIYLFICKSLPNTNFTGKNLNKLPLEKEHK